MSLSKFKGLIFLYPKLERTDHMASIEKRGKGYRITVSTGYGIDGKKLFEKDTFIPDSKLTDKQKKKALDNFVYDFEQRVRNGKYLSGEKITLKEFTEKWLKEYGKQNLAETSYSNYLQHIDFRILPALGHLKLAKIGPMQIQSFYNNLTEDGVRLDGKPGGYSMSTIKKSHAVLSSILETAVRWQAIENNPCDRVSIPKQLKESAIKHFTLEQSELFLKALDMEYTTTYKAHKRTGDTGIQYTVKDYTETRTIPEQFKIFFYIALFGGLRRGEILALTWDDIDFTNHTVNINKSTSYVDKKIITKSPKNKTSYRMIALPESVIKMLKKYRLEQKKYRLSIGDQWQGDNYIFIQSTGKQMHPSTPYHTFKDILNKYNKIIADESLKLPNIPLHGLRHTSATLLISNNLDIVTVSKRLGHAQTSTTTNIYAHSLKKLDETAANTFEDIINKKVQ